MGQTGGRRFPRHILTPSVSTLVIDPHTGTRRPLTAERVLPPSVMLFLSQEHGPANTAVTAPLRAPPGCCNRTQCI